MKKEIIRIELYHTFFKDKSINEAFEKNGYNVSSYSFFKKEGNRFITKKEYIIREFICLLKVCLKLKDFCNKKILCLGGYYSVLLICRLFSFLLGKNFHLYIYNFYIHDAGEKKIVKKILRFLLNNKKLTLIVQSPQEVNYYKSLTKSSIYFVPYCADLPSKEINNPPKILDQEYIFTGGYTNRDYSLIMECAARFTQYQFVLAISSLNTEINKKTNLPNVCIYKDITKKEFEKLVADATIVIIPLKNNVGSSGQMLCISAMQNKKPIIYANLSSINYYFTGDSGMAYKTNDLHSLETKLNSIIKDKTRQKAIGNAAYDNYINNFTTANRNSSLFNIVNKN